MEDTNETTAQQPATQTEHDVIPSQQPQPETAQQPLTSNDAQAEPVQNGGPTTGNQPEAINVEATPTSADTPTAATDSAVAPSPDAETQNDDVTQPPAPPTAPEATSNGSSAVATPNSNGMNRMTRQEVDMAELKVKIICQEKNNMALKMELKCAELQVAAKEKLDVKKTRLIELLDAKLAAIEKKNLRLIEMMEQMVKDKDTHSHRLIDATKNMEELGRRLAESEKARADMRHINLELKTMLGNVEDKGMKISQLAKEKVLKFKGENERIQRELDDLKGGGSGSPTSSGSGSATPQPVSNNVDEVESSISSGLVEPGTAPPSSTDGGFPEAIGKTVDLCGQLEAAVVGRDWAQEASIDALRAALVDAVRVAGELRPALDQLQRVGTREAATAANNAARVSAENVAAKVAREKQRIEELEAKEREIATLKDELARLKMAIGQLVGLNFGAPAAAAAAAVAVTPVAPSNE